MINARRKQEILELSRLWQRGDDHWFMSTVLQEILLRGRGNDCTGKELQGGPSSDPWHPCKSRIWCGTPVIPHYLEGRDKCLLLASPSEIPSSRFSESPIPKEQGGRWSRETPEVGLSQASTPKHTHTQPCIQHVHTNTIPLEALKMQS